MAGYRQKASRKLTDKQKAEVVERARERIEYCWNFERDNRRESEIDLEFVAGNQWPDYAKQQRGTTRPMLTINQMPQFVQQITNPTRQADIGIKAVPVDDSSDPELAKIYNGIIKQIEYQSNAKQVYVWGHECQAKCAIGWWQVCIEYVDDTVFDKEIRLKRIEHPLSVYCDPGAVQPAREDAMWMAVLEDWPLKTFEARYPDADKVGVDVPGSAAAASFEWATKDTVTVAMYFEKVPIKKLLALLPDGSTIDATGKGEAELGRLDIQAVRECDTFRVDKYILSGKEVLEGSIEWPGKFIPLVPVIGGETPRKGGTMRYGVVRFARDPQQLLNFYETAAAESIALAPKAPYLATPTQIGPHQAQWDQMSTKNFPYMLYTPDSDAPGPPKREHPPETPVAALQQVQGAREHMKSTTGIYDAARGATSNEVSGRGIAERKEASDTANSHFADNLFSSLAHTGRILIDLIPEVYDNERVVRLLDEQGVENKVTINRVLYEVDGEPVMDNDLSAARFDVRVTVGQSFLTKRIEAMQGMVELAKSLPPQAQLLFLDLIVKNSDWPGAEELAKRFRSLVPPEALADPNDPDAPKPPDPMDDPSVRGQLEKLAAEIEKLKADARNKDADTEKTLIEAEQMASGVGGALNGARQQPAPPPPPPSGFVGGELAA